MNCYENILEFQGTWRNYQARVLEKSDKYLKDGKIHIVAAPGSGKTTLGIELIRRLGAPCLILSPSITIRQQWLERIREGFVKEGAQADGLLSGSIRNPGKITAITYQALHSCMSQYKGTLEEETEGAEENGDAQETEEVDFTGFDIFKVIQETGIKIICLDEAHHLRSEWWAALEELVSKAKGMTIISLTATPPYDSTVAQWERYIGLCGEIDEEIIAPELVKEGSLCPHQDYVYFNFPTKEEEKAVEEFRQETESTIAKLQEDEEFTKAIAAHPGLLDPTGYAESFLENPRYLSSILIYLNSRKVPFSPKLTRLLGLKGGVNERSAKLPECDLYWMEILLQGFLYEDKKSYPCGEEYQEKVKSLLKAHGMIQKNKVGLVVNESLNKMLVSSKGKLNSIAKIAEAERSSMGQDLRLLVLCDYIKGEFLSHVGNEEKEINEIGVIPVFEMLRRTYGAEGKLGVLSGSVVIIPTAAKEVLEGLLAEKEMQASFSELNAPGYVKVTVKGKGHQTSALITELFNQGMIEIMVGTKSLLGEGWDSPCINSLILATFVGSFMLSNQMRGRAIRTQKGDPDKTGNIWHLVCLEPESGKNAANPAGSMMKSSDGTAKYTAKSSDGTAKYMKQSSDGSEQVSKDFETLKRRFEGFMGVHYTQKVIENGLERLDIITPPFNRKHTDEINQAMLEKAENRAGLRKHWEESLVIMDKMEITSEDTVDNEKLKAGAVLKNAFTRAFFCCALCLCGVVVLAATAGSMGTFGKAVWAIAAIAFGATGVKAWRKGMRLSKPYFYLEQIGKGILSSMKKMGQITSQKATVVVEQKNGTSTICLKNATLREKDLFSTTTEEFFSEIVNQRYLLQSQKKKQGRYEYYCVPELFSKKKEDVQLLAENLKGSMGVLLPVYTRNEEGRKVLLEARLYAFANNNGKQKTFLTGTGKKKRVQSALH